MPNELDTAGAHTLATQARAAAAAALEAKDFLHRQLGARIDSEIERVAAAWRQAELALQAEQLTWIRAHGSAELQAEALEALSVGRAGAVEWRQGTPLDWAQAERLAALRPRVAQEWLMQHRPGWVAWAPISKTEREQARAFRQLGGSQLDQRFDFTNPVPVAERTAFQIDAPDITRTTPVRALMSSAHRVDDSATLGAYTAWAPETRERPRYCAIAKVRLPGGYDSVQIALRETPEQARQLDAVHEVLHGRRAAIRTYEEKLAAIAEIETGNSAALLPDGQLRGTLLRVDEVRGVRRGLVARDASVHVVLLSGDALRSSEGAEIELARGQDDGRVFVAAPDEPVAITYEDVDAVQQLELTREVMRLADCKERTCGVEQAAARLRDITLRAEARLGECRTFDQAVGGWLDSLAPQVREVRRDSALATERLAWLALRGTPALARGETTYEFESGLRSEWLGVQSGWRPRAPDERAWKRVALEGPNTVHPALTQRDSEPVIELMTAARAHAPDAVLMACVPSDRAHAPRAEHCALIVRRAPGARAVEALLRDETPQQKRVLDVRWKERLRALEARPPLIAASLSAAEARNAAERLQDRVQREFGLPAAPLPDAHAIHGRLIRVEQGEDRRHRAIVVNDRHVHVVSVLPNGQVERLVGKAVSVEKTAGRVKITGRDLEHGLGR